MTWLSSQPGFTFSESSMEALAECVESAQS